MPTKRPYLTPAQAFRRLVRVEKAIEALREARQELRIAGAKQAASYVARCLKSAEGARRHAEGMNNEAWRLAREADARLVDKPCPDCGGINCHADPRRQL